MGKLDRNWLKGAFGDAARGRCCGFGHNLRMIRRRLRLLCGFMLGALLDRRFAYDGIA
jgi:IS5 family transposase